MFDNRPGPVATRSAYMPAQLLQAKSGAYCQLSPATVERVRSLGLVRRHRGTRAGCNKQRPIHKVTPRSRDLVPQRALRPRVLSADCRTQCAMRSLTSTRALDCKQSSTMNPGAIPVSLSTRSAVPRLNANLIRPRLERHSTQPTKKLSFG
jgi:hypothetical protein